MTQTIYIDDGIMDLVKALNQIKGVTTVASCEGHGEKVDGYIAFRCPVEIAVSLMDLLWKNDDVVVQFDRDYEKPLRPSASLREEKDMVWGQLIFLPPLRRPPEFQAKLVADIKASSLFQEACTFEILPKSKKPEGIDEAPNLSPSNLYMTKEKYERLKEFTISRWEEQIKKLKSPGWDGRRMNGFPEMAGNYITGYFNYKNYDNFPVVDVWQIRWHCWRIVMELNLYDYGHIRVTSLNDIEGKTFLYDDIIRFLLSS